VQALYDQNAFTTQFTNIPFYNTYIIPTDTYNLQAVQRIKIGGDPACDDLNAGNLNTVLTRSQQIYTLCKWVSILVLIFAGIGLLVTVILFMMRGRVIVHIYPQVHGRLPHEQL
jgi:hypothetical protein